MNDLFVGDEKLISTNRASELTSYSKDYIGQLCREEKVECRRVSGNWYVDEASLKRYQETGIGITPKPAAESEPQEEVKKVATHGMKVGNVRDDTFKYDGVEYIATSRAADITGYAQDYVGQLARDGEVQARKVGRRWFVDKAALLKHKKYNDGLLAQVQAQASGIRRPGEENTEHLNVASKDASIGVKIHTDIEPGDINFNVRYFAEPVETFSRQLPPSIPPAETLGEKVLIQKAETEVYAPRDIPAVPVIKRIPTVTSGQTPQVGRDEIAVRNKSLKQSISREQEVQKLSAISKEAKEEAYHFEEPKQRALYVRIIMYVLPLLIIASGAAAFTYIYGIPEIHIDSKAFNETIDVLREKYGEVFPGAEFSYTAE